MDDTAKVPRKPDSGKPDRRPLADEELADQLLGKAQAEGVNTRTKMIKRQMYGRAGFTLLRHRILLS